MFQCCIYNKTRCCRVLLPVAWWEDSKTNLLQVTSETGLRNVMLDMDRKSDTSCAEDKMGESIGKWLNRWEIESTVDALTKYDVEIVEFNGEDGEILLRLDKARQSPDAIGFLTDIYKNPVTRLRPDLLVEANDSVSTIVPLLAREMGIPYLKFNTASGELDEEARGHSVTNKRAVIITDTIENAEAIMPVYRACKKRRLDIGPMIALLDMANGWRRNFDKFQVDMPVWPGMSIDDMRRSLMSQGYIERPLEEGVVNPVIFSLEGKKWDHAMHVARSLQPLGCLYQVSDHVVEYSCADIVGYLGIYGPVIVDLNISHAPAVAGDICTRLKKYRPWAVTVDGFSGEKLTQVAVKSLRGSSTRVLVNALAPALDKAEMGLLHATPKPERLIDRIAESTNRAQADGIVCAPEHVLAIKKRYPKMLVIAADARTTGSSLPADEDDPNIDALRHGASYVVVDMSVLDSADVAARAREVLARYASVPKSGEAGGLDAFRNVMKLEKKH